MGESKMVPSSLPLELHFEIHSYLTIEDLKALSSCSKYFRRIVIPSLYRGFNLSLDSAAALGNNQVHRDITDCIRHLTISTAGACLVPITQPKSRELRSKARVQGKGGAKEMCVFLQQCKTYLEVLHLFCNVKSLKLQHTQPAEYRGFRYSHGIFCGHFPGSLFKKLASVWAPYNHLRRLVLDLKTAEGTVSLQGLDSALLLPTGPRTYDVQSRIPWPPNIEDLTTYTDIGHQAMYTRDHGLMKLFEVMWHSARTLKSLDLSTCSVSDTEWVYMCPTELAFETLKKLTVSVRFPLRMTRKFPNIEELTVKPGRSPPGLWGSRETKADLNKLGRLKRVLIPWAEDDLNHQTGGPLPKWRTNHLTQRLEALLKQYGPSGQQNLQKLVLVRSAPNYMSLPLSILVAIIVTAPEHEGEKIKWCFVWESMREQYPDLFELYDRQPEYTED
ncbi:hypothetical protein TWF281_009009 [Arthrobotrys megalospora]